MVSKQNYSIIINKHIAFKLDKFLPVWGLAFSEENIYQVNYELGNEMKTTCSYQINNSTFPSE